MTSNVCLTGNCPKLPKQSVAGGELEPEQLDQFFKTTDAVQKLFKVNGVKVGIIFGPKAKRIKVRPFGEFGCQVFLILEKELPDHVLEKITSKIPSKYSWYHIVAGVQFERGQFDGKSIFQVLEFE
ncbi:MAG TPA: hypothetical protein VFU89_05945 [Rhabdochlamydiaceae bacterium]|nr:hypothetical protein [Rhabdochlamydiaceae bacterium]